jgi:hypothetical protein
MAEVKTTTFHSKLGVASVAMFVIGAVLLGVFAMRNGTSDMIDFVRVGMFGWIFWMWVTLGMVGLIFFHHTVRGKWGAPLLRVWEAGANPITLIAFGLIYIVIFFVAKEHLYEWTIPAKVASDSVLQSKSGYLNEPFFLIRIALYFAFFLFGLSRLTGWMKKEEQTGDKKWSDKRNNFAAPAIVCYVLCINFMMTDVGMSLDPHWFSTIYGIWQMIGMVLAGLSFAAMILGSQNRKAPYSGVIDATLTRDIGNLMLAFSMVWAYFTLSQYLITYSGNLPEFNIYYVIRREHGWAIWGGIGVLAQFFIPFLMLLSPSMKRKPGLFTLVAAWIFCARFIDLYYTFTPSLKKGMTPDNIGWLAGSIGSLLIFGGIWMVLFVIHVKKKPLLTESHPYLAGGHDHQEEAVHVA